MENYVFVDGGASSLVQQMFVINKLKKLNKNYFHYGFRETKNGEHFYLYGTRTRTICATPRLLPLGGGYKETRLGFCEYKYNKNTKTLYLSLIRVNEKYQGQGVGDQMLEYVKEVAKKLGANSITLDRLCVYTNGKECVTFYGDEQTLSDIMDLKEQGKPVVDKNLKFYTKHGFLKDDTRRPAQPHLVPMVLPKLKAANPNVAGISKVYRFKLKRKEVLVSNENFECYSKKPIETLTEAEFNKKFGLNNRKLL